MATSDTQQPSWRKTFVDAGYIAVGLGVMGFQQAQERGRVLKARVSAAVGRAHQCTNDRAGQVKGFVNDAATSVAESGRQLDERGRVARDRAEEQVRATVARAGEFGTEVAKRVEPVVEQVQSQLGELPERVVQVMEPVAARVRELAGSAA
jgi:hypothetical protein